MSAEARYLEKIDRSAGPAGCWPWTAAVNPKTGYGVFHDQNRKTVNAHRYGAILAGIIEPVGDPRVVDHSCHNGAGCPPGPCVHRRCQNPAHFEATGNAVNVNRSHNSNAQKTSCPRGHPYAPENTRLQTRSGTTGRSCKTCARDADRTPNRRRTAPYGR